MVRTSAIPSEPSTLTGWDQKVTFLANNPESPQLLPHCVSILYLDHYLKSMDARLSVVSTHPTLINKDLCTVWTALRSGGGGGGGGGSGDGGSN